MTWAAEFALLTNPVLDNHADPDRIGLPGRDLDEDLLDYTNDPTAPRVWLDVIPSIALSEYLASGGGQTRHIHGVVEVDIYVEPCPLAGKTIRDEVDNLETWYAAASNLPSLIFRTEEATLSDIIKWEKRWIRADWICPFWRFE